MKKYFLILAGLLLLVPDNSADAKAVKLGRGNAYSVAKDAKLASGGSAEINTKKECDASCTTCDTTTGQCTGCSDGKRPDGNRCVDNCYNITCKSGYTTEVSSDSCCCVSSSPCGAMQVYNEVIGKCVKAVCPVGCTSGMCSAGYCSKCDTGYYLSYDTGMCPTCSSAIANCAICSSSALGPTCTKCNSGYTLSGGKCVAAITCPSNCSTCSSSSTCTKCSSGYYLSSGSCVSCPANATCSGTSSFSCKSGYERYNNTCKISPCDGISSTPTWCQDGYTRVEGKGCCPAGVDPNRVGACLQCAVR